MVAEAVSVAAADGLPAAADGLPAAVDMAAAGGEVREALS